MFRRAATFILLWTTAFAVFAPENRVLIATLNCYAFFGGNEMKMQFGQPQMSPDYGRKAGNRVGLWPTNAPLHDPFALLSGKKNRTPVNGNTYDRIFLAGVIMSGASGLQFENISVREHPYDKGTNRYWFADHFPVTVALSLPAKK